MCHFVKICAIGNGSVNVPFVSLYWTLYSELVFEGRMRGRGSVVLGGGFYLVLNT